MGPVNVFSFIQLSNFRVDSDPIADIRALQNVTFVMKDGEIFKK